MNNKNWFEYPQQIKVWTKNIDYVMFIDENNSVDKQQLVYKNLVNNKPISDDDRYFTITGCLFEPKGYSKMRNDIRKLKDEIWGDGFYYDSKAKESRYVCFHSRDIKRHDGAFNDSIINHALFTDKLTEVLKNIECKIISVTIDVEEFVREGKTENIYEKAFDLLLERYIYATKSDKKRIIMLESRGKNEDRNLLNHINKIIFESGTYKIRFEELQKKIMGVYFNPKWYGGHSSTFAGLEVADLFSYPIHQYVKYKKENPAFDVLKKKIDGFPNIDGKVLKIYPKEKNDISHS